MYTVAADPRQIIRDLCKARKIKNMAALAEASGVPQPTLSRYMSGKHATMTSQHWFALAKELGVTVSELLGETPLATQSVREINSLLAQMTEADRERAARLLRALTQPPG